MIYYVRCDRTNGDWGKIKVGHIKVGTTIRLSSRLGAIVEQIYLRGTLDWVTVLGVSDGSYERESELHRQFSAFRVENEWFRPEPPLIEHIKKFARPWDWIDEVPAPTKVDLDAKELADAKMAAATKGVRLGDYLRQLVTECVQWDLHQAKSAGNQPWPPVYVEDEPKLISARSVQRTLMHKHKMSKNEGRCPFTKDILRKEGYRVFDEGSAIRVVYYFGSCPASPVMPDYRVKRVLKTLADEGFVCHFSGNDIIVPTNPRKPMPEPEPPKVIQSIRPTVAPAPARGRLTNDDFDWEWKNQRGLV